MESQGEQHDAFQRREWRTEGIGWGLMGLLVLAGLVGPLGGPGPLSWATATGSDDLLTVGYTRLGHLEADDRMTVTLSPAAVNSESVDFEVAGSWVRAMDTTGIVRQPREQAASPYGPGCG